MVHPHAQTAVELPHTIGMLSGIVYTGWEHPDETG